MTELFIKIPSSALAIGSDKKLTVEEVNLFAWLQTMISWLDFQKKNYHISCDLNLLVKVLGLNKNNLSRGKNKVMENLTSLKEKGYLSFIETDYKTLEINLHIKQDDIKAKPKFTKKEIKYAGFIKIPISLLNQVKTKYDITILALVVLRSGLEDYQITRSEWQEVLEVSIKTTVEVVTSCKLVKTTIGKYIKKDRQEANTYELIENTGTDNLENTEVIYKDLKTVKTAQKDEGQEMSPLEKMFSQVSDTKVKDDIKLFKKLVDFNEKMDSEAYLVYMETDDLILKEYAERKISKMRNSEDSKKKLDKIIRGAYDIRRVRELKKETETFGTKAYFEERQKMYISLIKMGKISSEEFREMEKYIKEQLDSIEKGIECIEFSEWNNSIEKEVEFKDEVLVEDGFEEQVIEEVDLPCLDEDDSESYSSDSLDFIEETFKEESIIDNMLKKISDERVKFNKKLFKEIQDYKTEMTLEVYEIYMSTDDGNLRKYARIKLENNPEMCIKLDNQFRKKQLAKTR